MSFEIGFIGLGSMGGHMARNLLDASYSLVAYDIDAETLDRVVEAGATPAGSTAEVVRGAEVVMTSLPYSHTFVEVAEEELIPNARSDQVFVDLGTVAPPQARRLANEFAERDATLLDVPVSGGSSGAKNGTLRIFAGGERATFERILPVLEVLGDPDRIAYCGPSGSGQVVKGVNQLAMGLRNAALLEPLALAVRAGVDLKAVIRSVGGGSGWRGELADAARQILDGNGKWIGVKSGQLPYYLAEADRGGFDMPLTRALHEFLKDADKVVMEVNRPSPSFWHELMGGMEPEEYLEGE
ncbi:MAG: NAD(P)-dependent oxidoreductase [Candidatus Brocadiia bacterium]